MAHGAVSFDEALEAARELVIGTEVERLGLDEAAGRVLAEDVASPVDNPAHTNSAMDGFAVRAADLPGQLWVVGESRAGSPWEGELAARRAVKISTGAAIPEGADAVVPVEAVRESGGWVSTDEPVRPGQFIRTRGEDVRAGQVVMAAGASVRPHEVTMFGGLGIARVGCRRRVRVALVSSGDELVPPGAPRSIGQVYDASAAGLAAQARAAGGEVVWSAHVPDDPDRIEAVLAPLLEAGGDDERRPDLIVTTGGVSVGRHDHLRSVVLALGAEQVVWGVDMRPGHPLFLARHRDQVVLGLPGNPVSSMVCFHVFGREIMGVAAAGVRRAPMAAPYAATTERTELIRCRWGEDGLAPVERQGSHAIGDLAGADALAVVPAGLGGLQAGEMARFIALD